MQFEIDPDLLTSASELLADLAARLEADASSLARLDSQEARELAQDRLETAKLAESLSYLFGTR